MVRFSCCRVKSMFWMSLHVNVDVNADVDTSRTAQCEEYRRACRYRNAPSLLSFWTGQTRPQGFTSNGMQEDGWYLKVKISRCDPNVLHFWKLRNKGKVRYEGYSVFMTKQIREHIRDDAGVLRPVFFQVFPYRFHRRSRSDDTEDIYMNSSNLI